VANQTYSGTGGNVTVYAPGKSSTLRTISQGIALPVALAFGLSGYLNVANVTYHYEHDAILEYPPGSGKLQRTVSDGVSDPDSIAFGP
jgi:hypothetical protein